MATEENYQKDTCLPNTECMVYGKGDELSLTGNYKDVSLHPRMYSEASKKRRLRGFLCTESYSVMT